MSRPLTPDEDVSLDRIADSLDRLADTADDYVDIVLGAQEMMQGLQSYQDPLMRDTLQPLLDGLDAIRTRRENR